MTHYAGSSVVVDPIPGAASVISQPTSQALVLANTSRPFQQFPISIPTGQNPYMYGSYGQPMYGGYGQSMPVYVQPQQQVVYSMPRSYGVPSYGYGGMPMASAGYMPGASVIVQDPYGYSGRRRRRHRRHSYSGYGSYY